MVMMTFCCKFVDYEVVRFFNLKNGIFKGEIFTVHIYLVAKKPLTILSSLAMTDLSTQCFSAKNPVCNTTL